MFCFGKNVFPLQFPLSLFVERIWNIFWEGTEDIIICTILEEFLWSVSWAEYLEKKNVQNEYNDTEARF